MDDVSLEIIVVDGLSTDGTAEIVRKKEALDSRVQLVSNVKRVTPVALNLGISHAQHADVKIILGAHSEIDFDFIHRNLEVLKTQPEADCVGGVIENIYENETAKIVGLAMSSRFGVGDATFRIGGKAGFVETVAFGAYRKELFDKIGLFDERLVRNQDDEFNFRILKTGGKIYFDPSIKSKYFVRSSLKKLSRQYFQYGYWKVYVNAIHKTITTWRQTIPFLFVLFLFFGIILSPLSEAIFTVFLLGMLTWGSLALTASVERKCPFWKWPNLILVFFILHFFYGLGYAKGVLYFLIFKKTPNTFSPNITR